MKINQFHADRWFERLQIALRTQPLPTRDGGTRQAEAPEFMLMDCTSINGHEWAFFKHRHTRNYLHLRKDGVITIPTKGSEFHGGTFDDYPVVLSEPMLLA
jgi:hypothetical protein